MKHDPGLSAVRAIRSAISHEFGNDPNRLIAHYVEMQSRLGDRAIIQGSEKAELPDSHQAIPRTAQLSNEPGGHPR
jgi:hypothetical protein